MSPSKPRLEAPDGALRADGPSVARDDVDPPRPLAAKPPDDDDDDDDLYAVVFWRDPDAGTVRKWTIDRFEPVDPCTSGAWLVADDSDVFPELVFEHPSIRDGCRHRDFLGLSCTCRRYAALEGVAPCSHLTVLKRLGLVRAIDSDAGWPAARADALDADRWSITPLMGTLFRLEQGPYSAERHGRKGGRSS